MKKEDNRNETFLEWLMPSKVTLGLFFGYTLVVGLFLYFLNQKTNSGFGISEIAFAIIASFILTSVMVWIKALEEKNSYLGLIIGIATVAYLSYAIFIRFWGPYTIVFLAIGALISMLYLTVYFLKIRKEGE